MHTRQGVAAHPHSEHIEVSEIPTRPLHQAAVSLAPCGPGCRRFVPDQVWTAIGAVLHHHGPCKRPTFSLQLGYLMAVQGWRFCKCYRHQVTAAHAAVYALLDPVQANYAADDIRSKAAL
jgi:hypothetical protein